MALLFTSLLRAFDRHNVAKHFLSEFQLNFLYLGVLFKATLALRIIIYQVWKESKMVWKKIFLNFFWQVVKLRTKNFTRKPTQYKKKIFGELSYLHASTFHWNFYLKENKSLIWVNGMKTRMLLQKWFHLIVVPIMLVSLEGQRNLFSSGLLTTT